MVLSRPVSSGTAGAQSRCSRAAEMSGLRCRGSSVGKGRNTSWEREPVISMIFLGKFVNSEFARVAKIERTSKSVGIHETDEAFDHVVDVAKGARLPAFAVDGDGFALEGLNDEVGNDAAIVGMHARPVGVEDAGDADIELVLAVIIEEQGFGTTLAFVVAATRADGVDVAPVTFALRMDGRVAVDLAGRGLEDARAQTLGQAEHVDGAMHAGLGCLDRIVLVMNRRGRAGQVENAVHLEVHRKGDVVAQELEAWVAVQMLDVALCAGEKVVEANNLVAAFEKPVDEV
eukprot:TRINITY_DN7135_c0_g1_i18.p2 TRINITY_DN7135_c0_g1~~TRINITY_DN7135_c0_g1_i18.p2  ORF type:complete len:288 (+),score=22.95 TRINITY_DN7135_c0_g1_i18:614-1477(+)